MRYRKFGVQAAMVNDRLLDEYKRIKPDVKNDSDIISRFIVTELIFRPIETAEDIEDAKKYAMNLLYSNLGEWINAQLRKEVINHLSVCKNCKMLSNNCYCPILGAVVNPNQEACTNL